MSGTDRYRAILSAPHVTPLVLASVLARLPMGIGSLAMVLFVSGERDSFGVAGVVSGAFGLGGALGMPLQSRLIDRRGQRAVLLSAVLVNVVAIAAVVVLTTGGAAVPLLALAALAAGAAQPNVTSALRTLWPGLLRGDQRLLASAFALDSVAVEAVFATGPLITALAVATVSPLAAVVVAAAVGLIGTTLFCAQHPSRSWRPDPQHGPRSALGALRSPGVRTLMLTVLPLGFAFGAMEIMLPAYAKEEGKEGWAGILLSLWALASAGGGLLYGARTWSAPLTRLFLGLGLALPLAFLPVLAAPGVLAMAVLVLVPGMLVAPLLATSNQLVGLVAPRGMVTEAYAWPLTALVVGFAAGIAVCGALVQAQGWHAAVLAAALAAGIGFLCTLARRGSLDAAIGASHAEPAREEHPAPQLVGLP